MREPAPSTPSDLLLRADSLSRIRTSASRREEILAEFERSGLSGARFARLHGINYQTFMAWRRKRAEPAAEPDRMGELAARLGLREVGGGTAIPGEGSAGLEIEIGGTVKLRVATARQADLAARIIGHLRGAPPIQPC